MTEKAAEELARAFDDVAVSGVDAMAQSALYLPSCCYTQFQTFIYEQVKNNDG